MRHRHLGMATWSNRTTKTFTLTYLTSGSLAQAPCMILRVPITQFPELALTRRRAPIPHAFADHGMSFKIL